MAVRTFALALGLLYAVAGVLGFIPALKTAGPVHGDLLVHHAYGYLFGLFPVNAIHNLVHLGIGVWGLLACGRFSSARLFARGVAILYGVLTVMGLFPAFSTLFGLAPLFGHDVWLHALTAIVSAGFGWMPTQQTYYRTEEVTR